MLIRLTETLSVDPDKVVAISKRGVPKQEEGYMVFINVKGEVIMETIKRDYFFVERLIDKWTWLINNKVDWNSQAAKDRIVRLQKERELEDRSTL